jgi:hypothetical protein
MVFNTVSFTHPHHFDPPPSPFSAPSIPKMGIPKNKSRIRGVFFNPKNHHQFTMQSPRSHHKFTIKKPRFATRFSQNPLQKHQNPPTRKKLHLCASLATSILM